MSKEIPEELAKECRIMLKDYLFKAGKKDITINQVAEGMKKRPQTLTRFLHKDSSPTLDTVDEMNEYMRKNPM
jgi:hypothetical protein